MPGPAPSPNARRRNAGAVFTVIPSERKGRAPAWPLPTPIPSGMLSTWRKLWRTPMATQWEQLRYPDLVARYVLLLSVFLGKPGSELAAELRQMEDRLGLSTLAVLKHRWTIEDLDPDTKRRTKRVRGAGDVVPLFRA